MRLAAGLLLLTGARRATGNDEGANAFSNLGG